MQVLEVVLSLDVSLAAATALCSGSSDSPAQHPSSTGTLHATVTTTSMIRRSDSTADTNRAWE
jgi:hypothetical protein